MVWFRIVLGVLLISKRISFKRRASVFLFARSDIIASVDKSLPENYFVARVTHAGQPVPWNPCSRGTHTVEPTYPWNPCRGTHVHRRARGLDGEDFVYRG